MTTTRDGPVQRIREEQMLRFCRIVRATAGHALLLPLGMFSGFGCDGTWPGHSQSRGMRSCMPNPGEGTRLQPATRITEPPIMTTPLLRSIDDRSENSRDI